MTLRITTATFNFLRDLGVNNSTAWFQAHREAYTSSVKAPMRDLIRRVNDTLRVEAPEYASTDEHPMSRPNRDIRFSADKSPYRTDISAIFPCRGRPKEESAGFFIRLDADGLQVLGGAYMPGSLQLKAIRSAIAADARTIERIVAAPALRQLMGTLQGESLQRVPAGFDSQHPAAALLRRKQFYFTDRLSRRAATASDLDEALSERLRVLIPFVRWLDSALAPPRP
jgi:uncharacterized protein (TIGR02453 family)